MIKSDFADVTIAKSNILFIGPTGSGKTLLGTNFSKLTSSSLCYG